MSTNEGGTPLNLTPKLAPLVRALVGKVADWTPPQPVKGITIEVIIEDVRLNWGRTDYLVSPVAGTGLIWVQATHVAPRVSA
jgi:hypothetical protein